LREKHGLRRAFLFARDRRKQVPALRDPADRFGRDDSNQNKEKGKITAGW
jgi:hypothetical protein